MKKSILLINRDVSFLTSFSIFSSEIGFDLNVALDKESALEEVNISTYLIVIDLTQNDLSPYELLNYFYINYSDIPRVVIMTKDMFNDRYIEDIYEKVYDVIVSPIKKYEDFRKRIQRAIDNYSLVRENISYQNIFIEKSFKAEMLRIISLILSRIDNYIDQILADTFVWKEHIDFENRDNENLKRDIDNFINNFKDKIMNLEEIIQVNEILFNKNDNNGIDINIIIYDLVKVMRYIYDKKFIDIEIIPGDIKKTKVDSAKIVQSFYYFIEDSVNSILHNKKDDNKIIISTKLIVDYENKEFIEVTFKDCCPINSNFFDLSKLENQKKSIYIESFSLYDIKKFLDSISGDLNISFSENEDFRRCIVVRIPII